MAKGAKKSASLHTARPLFDDYAIKNLETTDIAMPITYHVDFEVQ